MSWPARLLGRVFGVLQPPAAEPRAVPPVLPPPPAPAQYMPYSAGEFPATFPATAEGRPQVFDPALRHYRRAFRPGDPTFNEPDTARAWLLARRRALDHVLRRLAESDFGPAIVLRGSRLMRPHVGPPSREPGDLDFVLVEDPAVRPDEWIERLRRGLSDLVTADFGNMPVEFRPHAIRWDDIWTYERVPGRRVVLPWTSAAGEGEVQVDFTLGERLAEPDEWRGVPTADGGCVRVRCATPAQALAWKLLWLATDGYPEGKDVYDAVLLAERYGVRPAVVEETFRIAGETYEQPQYPRYRLDRLADESWPVFRAAYPWVEGDAAAWVTRLHAALDRGERPYPPPRPWLTPEVRTVAVGIRDARRFDRLPILADVLEEAGCEDTDVLDHFRAGGPHGERCGVVDDLTDAGFQTGTVTQHGGSRNGQ